MGVCLPKQLAIYDFGYAPLIFSLQFTSALRKTAKRSVKVSWNRSFGSFDMESYASFSRNTRRILSAFKNFGWMTNSERCTKQIFRATLGWKCNDHQENRTGQLFCLTP